MWRLATQEEKDFIIKNRINNSCIGAWGPLILGCLFAFTTFPAIAILILVKFSLIMLLLLLIPISSILLGEFFRQRIIKQSESKIKNEWDKELYVIEGEFIGWKFRQTNKHNQKYAIIKTEFGEYTVEDDISSKYVRAKYDTAPHGEQIITDSRMIIFCNNNDFEKNIDRKKIAIPYAEIYKDKKQC